MKINTELTGARVYIRDYRPADLDFAAGMWLDGENGRYLSDPARDYVDEAFKKHWIPSRTARRAATSPSA